jgi:hypothetical protein
MKKSTQIILIIWLISAFVSLFAKNWAAAFNGFSVVLFILHYERKLS